MACAPISFLRIKSLKTLYRYLRAFFLAVALTIRGEKPSQSFQHPLVDWTRELRLLVNEVYQAAEQNGIDRKAREATKLRLDGRLMSLETILATVKFHAAQEYPSLLQHGLNRDALNTIYASNINDQYWITSLIETETLGKPIFQASLVRLKMHLDQPPPM